MRTLYTFLLAIFTILKADIAANAQAAGTLDISFSTDGKANTDFGYGSDAAYSIAVQADEKIVVAGRCASQFEYNNFALTRYNADGSLDNNFGSAGKVSTDFVYSQDEALAVAIQKDGKIVVAGQGDNSFALARYNINGTLDTTFGMGGKIITDVGGGDIAYSVSLQNDGKIVLAGTAVDKVGQQCALVRYNTNGSLDSTFGVNGIATTYIGNSDGGYRAVIQPDNKIVVAGWSFTNKTRNDFYLARYNTDGGLDYTFGDSGKVSTDFSTSNETARALMIQADGKIVVAGYSGSTLQTMDFALARYNTNGRLDSTFDDDGKVTTMVSNIDDWALAVAEQADGKIVAAGYSNNGSTLWDFSLVRYNTDGSLDNTFGNGGKTTTDYGNNDNAALAVAIQKDGNIVLAGYSGPVNNYDFAVARYNADGASAISEKDESIDLRVYPNPFSAQLTLIGEGKNGEAVITDMTGKEALRIQIFGSKTTINTEALKPGIYLLNYREAHKTSNIKLTKF